VKKATHRGRTKFPKHNVCRKNRKLFYHIRKGRENVLKEEMGSEFITIPVKGEKFH